MKRKFEYLGFRDRTCDIVQIGIDWFDYRDDESDLPKVGAFCRKCAKETAKPMMPIYMNGKPAYALHCNKCGSEYPMYKSMFVQRYVGYDTAAGGHVNPTHGMKSVVASMDRKARDYYNNREKCVEEQMCQIMNCSSEEYKEKKGSGKKKLKKVKRNLRKSRLLDMQNMKMKREKKSQTKEKNLLTKALLSM